MQTLAQRAREQRYAERRARVRARGWDIGIGRFPHKRDTKIYRMWVDMRARCGRLKQYLHVTVCEEWQDYATFRAWVCEQMRKLPPEVSRRSLSIDRENRNGNYEPFNCRLIPHLDNLALGRQNISRNARGQFCEQNETKSAESGADA